MKKAVMMAAMLMAVTGLKAQDCEALLLPYFHNDANAMASYAQLAPDKFEHLCVTVQLTFFESDTVPEGVDVYSISDVKSVATGENLPATFVVDLATLSFYAYNFESFRLRYPTGATRVCFSTPSSTHPYLVMRSYDEVMMLANIYENR
ncbi:MAG: hypothetical protein IJ745_03695 [Bacteroidales bacterium]|nr:hypothetical protein [Bacteroidales bacterium]